MEKGSVKKFGLGDYDVLATLGTGSFGRVRLARNKLTGAHFALKMLKKAEIIKAKQVDHVLNEHGILSRISHPFIIHMEGFYQDNRYLYLLLEFVPGGQLFTYLRGAGLFETSHAACYAAQVTLIFQHLHSMNIVYRDLKPENILIGEDGYLKLTDFGFAKVVETRTFTLCGTPEYLAPEILLNQGHGKPADWWTLGILIYEMNAGIDPFTDEDPMSIYQNIIKCKLKFPKSFDKYQIPIFREAKSLVRHLLVADLSKRFGNLRGGATDVKEHRWFAKIDWKALLQKNSTVYYRPIVKKPGDMSNFGNYPDSMVLPQAIKASEDPFQHW